MHDEVVIAEAFSEVLIGLDDRDNDLYDTQLPIMI